MRKQIRIFAFLIFIFVQIVGVWTTESSGAENLDMRLRLKPGQKYKMRLITELKRTETIEGRQEHESFMFNRGIGFNVKQVDANGVASIEVTFLTLKIDVIRAGGVSMEYDSTKQSISDDYSIEAAGVGESFVMKVTPKGEIIKLKGVEQMHERIIKKILKWDKKFLKMTPCATQKTSSICKTDHPDVRGWKDMSQKFKEQWKELRSHNTKAIYSEKEIKNMLSDMIMVFPDRSLAIGDVWTDKVKIWAKSQEIDGTYKLKDAKKGTVTVDLSAKRTAEEESFSWVNDEGHEVGFKLVGSCEGSFEIDQNTGWIMSSKFETQFTDVVIDPEANNQMPEPIMTQQELIIVEPME